MPPSSITALPHVRTIDEYETAFNARRQALRIESAAATIAGRVLSMLRRTSQISAPPVGSQPTMSWVDGPRTQPRDGRGRFLPRSWLADAELFLPADRAFFRKPLTEAK